MYACTTRPQVAQYSLNWYRNQYPGSIALHLLANVSIHHDLSAPKACWNDEKFYLGAIMNFYTQLHSLFLQLSFHSCPWFVAGKNFRTETSQVCAHDAVRGPEGLPAGGISKGEALWLWLHFLYKIRQVHLPNFAPPATHSSDVAAVARKMCA